MENEYKGKEISVKMLVDVLKKCFIFMIIAAVVIGAAAAVVTHIGVAPTYKATLAMWVINTTVTTDYATSALTSAASSIADSCTELVTQRLPAEVAVKECGLTEKLGYSSDAECIAAVRGSVSASKKGNDAFIFYVTVETDSVNKTYEIAHAFQETLPGVVTDLLDFKIAAGGGSAEEITTKNALKVISPITSVDDVAPSKVSPVLMAMLGGMLAAVAVYLIFMIRNVFDNGIYDENSIKNNFEEPVIGIIPSWNTKGDEVKKLRNSKDHYITRDYTGRLLTASAPFALTESFNALRANVIFAAASQKNPVVAVTSGFSGAGKSFVAANLAISMSIASKKTLLVECDMRCPVFSKMFKATKKEGLSELLAGMVEKTEDVVFTSEFGDFDIIASGKIPPNPSELLSSERMADLIGEWKNTYDVIILDMPPVCEVIDAGAVASVINGYIIAVRSNYSDLSEVRNAVSRLDSVGGNLFGFIVNDVSLKGNGKYYKKGYYYYGASNKV